MRPGAVQATTRSRTLMIASIMALSLLAGCFADTAPEHSALTLIDAHNAAGEKARRIDSTAHLAGFIANDRLREVPSPQWLLDHTGTPPSAGGDLRDGRADAWVLLYATREGRLMRALVQDAPLRVDIDVIVPQSDPVGQAIWAMNLGGRLLTDSDEAVQAARQADAALDAHARDHNEAPVAIASTVADVGDDRMDLVYAIYWGPPQGEHAFSRFAYVHHFTGQLIKSGDAEAYREDKRIVLIDTSFALGPVPREGSDDRDLDFEVEDAVLRVNATGKGPYTLRLLHENQTEAARVEGVALLETERHTQDIGTMPPGRWVLHVEVTGQVEFDLRIEGLVPVRPNGLP